MVMYSVESTTAATRVVIILQQRHAVQVHNAPPLHRVFSLFLFTLRTIYQFVGLQRRRLEDFHTQQ